MRITLITGFLGAGKTTFLRRFITEHAATVRTGVIINDLSQLEVDGELVRMGDLVSEKEGTLISIHDGSISGARRDDFVKALGSMATAGIGHLIIETSGSSEPESVIREILSSGVGQLHAVATLVDARMLLHDYDSGRDLLPFLENPPRDLTAESLLIGQLNAASVIILTKLDIIREEHLPPMLNAIMAINPFATLVGCAHGSAEPSVILEAPPYASGDISPEALLPARATVIESRVIRDPRPLHPQRFYDLYREHLGLGLFRSKGFVWFASRPGQVLLWNQAGGAMGLEFLSTWRAHILQTDTRLLDEEKTHLRATLTALHPVFGDRSCELTLIGHARDLAMLGTLLMDCFCTDEEISHWQNGGTFPDPWPANLRIMR